LRLCFYISGHGFGHAARDVEIVNALRRRDPSMTVAVRTAVPQRFLDQTLTAPVQRIDGAADTGVVQPDSLSIDEDETARRAAAFYADFEARVAAERAELRQLRADQVIGDIPPLAFDAADAAGLPSIAVSNFTWSWIYGGYPRFDALAPGARSVIAAAEAKAALALRLPFHGGFASMRHVEAMPLVARKASLDRGDTRRRLRLGDARPVVRATFGGHGANVPLSTAAAAAPVTIVATEYEVGGDGAAGPNLRVISTSELQRAGVTYTDLLAASDVVATKLGYGIVSECVANEVPLLYTPRGRFREQEVFEREMPEVVRCERIDRERLLAGDWSEAIERLLARPRPAQRMRTDGAGVVADRILEMG
jgi:L-arabinokinase